MIPPSVSFSFSRLDRTNHPIRENKNDKENEE